MSQEHSVFLQPLDVLFLRGNKLFGDAGSYGESLIPPWPSVAAGALRSRMMADDASLTATALQDPARFTLTAFHLARRLADGRVETLHALPADLPVQENGGVKSLRQLQPQALAAGIQSSATLPLLPVLAEGSTRQKITGGLWLTEPGWSQYLSGKLPDVKHLLASKDLWQLDTRVGVGLNADTRSVTDGQLFTMQAIALNKACDPRSKDGPPACDVGFVASANTALPHRGLVRLGGDGRAASIETVPLPSPAGGRGVGGEGANPGLHPGYETVLKTKRFKLILTTPGIFPEGWKLPGLDADNVWHFGDGAKAQLVSAAVPRAEVISGWDMAPPPGKNGWRPPNGAPKPAQRVAPTGSVYWLDGFTGTADDLRNISEHGLWPTGADNAARRAEGFNRCAIAHY